MPSTYTTNLGIELIANGDEDGTWGTITNENFDIIDRAINGSVALTLTGTTSTLTTSDGTLNDGQYKALILGGSPSGTHTITIAPNDAQKIYFVVNGTAQSVVLTQGSGGNVTVPVGRSALVYANGGGASAAVADFSANLVPVLSNAGVTSTATELNLIDGSVAGTIVNSKAVVYGAAGQVNATTLQIAGTSITSTAAELNLIDGSVAGTIVNSKAVVYGAAGQVNATTLQIAGTSITSTAAELNILDGVTATTAELNLIDGSVAGTIVNSKAVVYGAAGQVNATTLQIAGTSITSTAAELNVLDGITGMASQAGAQAGTNNATLMTPLRTAEAIAALASSISSIDVQEFTSGGTWTAPAGAIYCEILVVGGGQAGRAGTIGMCNQTAGSGGNAGGAAILSKIASALGATETVTIGAGGATSGASGATSSFGSHASATGASSTAGGAGSGTGAQGITGNRSFIGGATNTSQFGAPATQGASSIAGVGGRSSTAGTRGGGGGGGNDVTTFGAGGAGYVRVVTYVS